ncbi:hypothetical protein BSL84_29765 [Streptomyces sp. TN58]|nr:hypothetical protein BSL84_29765 [Streptomyces sp. TN58]
MQPFTAGSRPNGVSASFSLVVGLPITCLGAATYVLLGRGFSLLVIGLSLFLTGVVTALAGQEGER